MQLEKNPSNYSDRPPAHYKYLLNMIGVPHDMLKEDVQCNFYECLDFAKLDYYVGTALHNIWHFKDVGNLRDAKWCLERFGAGRYHLLAIECLKSEILKLEN